MMNYIVYSIVLGLMLAIDGNTEDKTKAENQYRLEKLEIIKDIYPRAIFFRRPESAAFLPYDIWEKDFSQLMGIEGKAIDEEKHISHTWRNAWYYSKFKKNYPDQLVLLHCNGMGRKPEFKPTKEDFFAGHWLYYEGVKIMSDVPDRNEITEIQVSDASQFFMDIGLRVPGFNDEIGLCELNEDGTPNWHKSEHVKLLDVDYQNNVLTVKRACFGSAPLHFKAGKSYAAAHCVSGPWQDTQLWAYNLSTHCPKDKQGKTCIDILTDDLACRFSAEGELAAFDGLEFDSFYWHPYLLNPRGESGMGSKGISRLPDANADGKPDNGFIDGISTYGLGVNLFVKKLREKLGPDRIIMGDGTHDYTQRAFGLMNGIESEGWPTGADPEFEEWSDGINRMQFWNENSIPPALSYMNFRYWGQVDNSELGANQVRMVIAASTLTGTVFAQFDPVEKFYSKKLPEKIPLYNKIGEYPRVTVFDELIMGEEKKKGWLGKPIGETICLAKNASSVLKASKEQDWQRVIKKIDGEVNAQIIDGSLKISSLKRENTRFSIRNIPVSGKYLTIFMTTTGEKMNQYPENVARLLWLEIPEENKKLKKHMAWVNNKSFESVFSFTNIESKTVTINIEIEGNEPFVIHEIEIYEEGDVRCREFENGIVLANPKSIPYTFNLSELFPEQKLQKIKGSPEQDPITNNGEKILTSTVELAPLDALFLIKE